MTTFMLLVPCIWVLTSASSVQPDPRTLSQCVDSFHDCVFQIQTTGSVKLRKALEILKSLDDEDMKALDASEIQLLQYQVNIIESNILQEDAYAHKNEEIPKITIEKEDSYSTHETSKDHENKNVKKTKKRHNQANPAFTVELSSRRSISDQVPVTFDDVIIDEGENFIPLLGLYRVPEPGVYAFYWSVDAPEGRVQTVLMKNGEAQKYGPLTQEIPSFSGTSSMSAVVECDQNDFVWVKVQSWPDKEACNVIEANYSSFSGFKIYTSSDGHGASAFMAQLSQNTSFGDSSLSTIIYDTALVNIGNDYYPSNGSFVCREDGLHVFTVSGHRANSNGYIYLYRNGNYVMFISNPLNTAVTSPTDTGTSSGTAVLECVRGDFFNVRDSKWPNNHMAEASSFTGYRLEDDQGVVAFTARPAADRDYLDGLQIDFDDVITNVGGSYFPGLKAFICQDQALYFLSWALLNHPESEQRSAEARLIKVKDGERMVMKAGPRSSRVLRSSWGRSTSTQAIVRCEQNAAFYIEAVVEFGSMTYKSMSTYFTGFKLPSSA